MLKAAENLKVARRREAALALKVAERARRRRGLLDPLFNLREAAKQMVLLEDHLSHPYKLCPDCVRKHLMTIEAFAEEATCLAGPDCEEPFRAMLEGLAERARTWLERLTDGVAPAEIAQEVRDIRKGLVTLSFDPREAAVRVASLYAQRQVLCPHRMPV
jgi:hypothetical protein